MSMNEVSMIIAPQQIPPTAPNVAPSQTPQVPDGGESIFPNEPPSMQPGGFELPNEIIEDWKEQFPDIFSDNKTEDIDPAQQPEGDVGVEEAPKEDETEKFYDDMKELTPDEREELLNNCSSKDKEILEEFFKYIDEQN